MKKWQWKISNLYKMLKKKSSERAALLLNVKVHNAVGNWQIWGNITQISLERNSQNINCTQKQQSYDSMTNRLIKPKPNCKFLYPQDLCYYKHDARNHALCTFWTSECWNIKNIKINSHESTRHFLYWECLSLTSVLDKYHNGLNIDSNKLKNS